jgi:spermidine/putrescine ABC transporter ATP-binding subunit
MAATIPDGLCIDTVWKRYGSVAALRGVSLSIPAGEFFVLLGGSGSGKTTLLRALAGFVAPDAGRLLLDGEDLARLPPHRRPVNMMFQSYALFPHMTVADNIGYGLRRAGMPRRAVAARVAELLALVRLEGFGPRRPDALSGGQQQRVALARALARRPRMLLLDEPLSALDRTLREETRAELAAVQRRLGTTFVLVTHDQEEALGLATRLGVMRDGVLAQVGTPREVYERPADSHVARFLGGANLLRATVLEVGPPALLAADGIAAPVLAAAAAPVGAAERVWLMLRPHQLRIDPAPACGCNQVPGALAEEIFQGETISRVVRLADGQALRLLAPSGPPLAIGTPVTLSWDPGDVHILLS